MHDNIREKDGKLYDYQGNEIKQKEKTCINCEVYKELKEQIKKEILEEARQDLLRKYRNMRFC
jgi:hypothetical protein